MSDIVERLMAFEAVHANEDAEMAFEAAKEIESLRTQLAEEIRISNERGQHIEQLEAVFHAAKVELSEARKDAEEAAIVRSDLVAALKLGLEYWRHRQQRYKNRHPIWVEAATKAIDRALIDKEQKSGKD